MEQITLHEIMEKSEIFYEIFFRCSIKKNEFSYHLEYRENEIVVSP